MAVSKEVAALMLAMMLWQVSPRTCHKNIDHSLLSLKEKMKGSIVIDCDITVRERGFLLFAYPLLPKS